MSYTKYQFLFCPIITIFCPQIRVMMLVFDSTIGKAITLEIVVQMDLILSAVLLSVYTYTYQFIIVYTPTACLLCLHIDYPIVM